MTDREGTDAAGAARLRGHVKVVALIQQLERAGRLAAERPAAWRTSDVVLLLRHAGLDAPEERGTLEAAGRAYVDELCAGWGRKPRADAAAAPAPGQGRAEERRRRPRHNRPAEERGGREPRGGQRGRGREPREDGEGRSPRTGKGAGAMASPSRAGGGDVAIGAAMAREREGLRQKPGAEHQRPGQWPGQNHYDSSGSEGDAPAPGAHAVHELLLRRGHRPGEPIIFTRPCTVH